METHSAINADVQDWIELLADHDGTQREQARKALVAARSTAVIPLIEQLKSPVAQVCWEAAKALAEIKDPAAANALAEALDHDDNDVRWVAADALIALGPEGLKQTLVALLTGSRSVHLRQAASHVVSQLAHRYRGEWLKPLLEKFSAFEPAVAIPPAALHALHEMERKGAQDLG